VGRGHLSTLVGSVSEHTVKMVVQIDPEKREDKVLLHR
jgi:hypothetical protein